MILPQNVSNMEYALMCSDIFIVDLTQQLLFKNHILNETVRKSYEDMLKHFGTDSVTAEQILQYMGLSLAPAEDESYGKEQDLVQPVVRVLEYSTVSLIRKSDIGIIESESKKTTNMLCQYLEYPTIAKVCRADID